ncbi:MAG: hypothetical protein ABI574_01940 [Burkholderiales bacterium]
MKATLLSILLALTAPCCLAQAGPSTQPVSDVSAAAAPRGASLQLAALDRIETIPDRPAYSGRPTAAAAQSLLEHHRSALGLGTALLLALGLVAHRRRPARSTTAPTEPRARPPRAALVPLKRSVMPTVCEGFMLSQFNEVQAPPDTQPADPTHFDTELRRPRPATRKPLPAQRARRQALRQQTPHKHLPSLR